MQVAAARPQSGEAKHAAASKHATPVSQATPELDSDIPAGLPLYLQRKCDSCAASEDDDQTLNRKAENPAPIPAAPTPPADAPNADKHDEDSQAGLPLYLQRKCDACGGDDDDQNLNRKAESSAQPIAASTPQAESSTSGHARGGESRAESYVESYANSQAELSPESQAGLPWYLQRKCAACSDESSDHLQRKESGVASAVVPVVVPSVPAAAPDTRLRSAIAASGTGQVLPAPIRQEMESRFGADLGAVRIHTGASAEHANRIANAEAFTLGERIYFGAGRYAPTAPAGRRLLAHELTHVVQNQRGTCPPAAAVRHRKINISRPDDAAEQEAERSAQAIDSGAPITVNGVGTGALHRAEKSTWDSVTDWGAARVNDAGQAVDSAGHAIAEGAGAVADAAGEQAMKLLRATVPALADIIDEGPINYFKRQVKEALDAHMPAALGGFSISELIDGVSSWVGDGASFIKGLLKGDAKSCDAFAKMMEGITSFVTGLIDNPVVGFFKSVFSKVTDFIGKVSKLVLAPIFDSLATLVSGAWTALKAVAKTVSGWFNSAKQALGAAWDAVMKKLGFDGEGEDGIWSKIKGFANDVWKSIKETLAPIMGPLETIGSVLSLLTPMGQIHAIVKYGPKLVKLATWIWDNGLSPEKIRTAPAEIKGMLESLSGGVDGFKGVLQTGFDWLTTQLGALGSAFLKMVGAITGLPLLGFAESLFKDAQKAAQDIVASVKSGAAAAIAAIEGAYAKVVAFITPYKEVLSSLILAIASPPMIPVILGGWAWRALPRCIKIPILNFILDIAITAIDAMPELPTFGVLWPLLKPGVMAFLGTLRAASDDVKELVSNKVAKVISGASPDFLIGFVKGFATGVWEGITDPFKAIWTVLEGLDTATQYLLSLAGAEDKSAVKEEPRTPAAPAASAAAPAPVMPTASAPAAPAKPAASAEIRKATPVPAAKPAAAAPAPVPVKPAAAAAPATSATAAKTSAPAAPAAAKPAAAPAPHKTVTATTAAPPPVPAVPVAAPPAAKVEAAAADAGSAVAEAEEPYIADPAAALNSGKPMPAATRRLLEKLAAQKAADDAKHPPAPAPAPEAEVASPVSVSAEDMPALKERASAMAGEISPDVETVKGGFWDAVQEYFSGDKMSFDDLVNKLSEAWESAKAKISEGGAWLANQMISFFKGGGAEGELGDKIGWLTGTIAFQALLDAITAGTWAGAGPILKGIAKFINWPMEAMGEAFKLLKTLGKYLIDGLKSLGGVIKDAAAGAFKTVSKALGNIGQRLLSFGEEILGKFGGKAAKAESKVAGVLGKEGVQLSEREAAQLARKKAAQEALAESEQKAAQQLEQQAGKESKLADEPHPQAEPKPQAEPAPAEAKAEQPKAAEPAPAEPKPVEEPKAPAEGAEAKKPADPAAQEAREASVAESGHVENDKLTPSQANTEVEQFKQHPQSLEGTAPNRRSKVGEHEWRETQVNGECSFCRYSPTKVCVKTPELRTGHLQNTEEMALEAEKTAQKQADAAVEARAKASAQQPLPAKEEQALKNELTEAEKRAQAAKARLKTERGNATRAATAGNAEKEEAARKEIAKLEAELKAAEGDAGAATELLNEQKEALRHADEAEALAKATKEEAEAVAARAVEQQKMSKRLDNIEEELAAIRKEQSKRMLDEAAHRRMRELENEEEALRKKLAANIEAGKDLTPEARNTLRAGTPFKSAGGAAREREFLENLPKEAKGPGGTYIDYVTGEPLPLSRLSPDHVVPVDEIFNMKGFDRLSPADRQAILDLPENLRLLERGLNSSKQAKGMAKWLASKNSELKLTPAARQALLEIEADARKELEKEIARRIAKAKVP